MICLRVPTDEGDMHQFWQWLRAEIAPDGLPDPALAVSARAIAWVITSFSESDLRLIRHSSCAKSALTRRFRPGSAQWITAWGSRRSIPARLLMASLCINSFAVQWRLLKQSAASSNWGWRRSNSSPARTIFGTNRFATAYRSSRPGSWLLSVMRTPACAPAQHGERFMSKF